MLSLKYTPPKETAETKLQRCLPACSVLRFVLVVPPAIKLFGLYPHGMCMGLLQSQPGERSPISCEIPKDSPIYLRTLSQMRAFGLEGEPTVQDIPVLGMIMKAAKNPLAFAIVRDTIGEQPVQQYEDLTPESPIVLGLVQADKVEKAKAEHEARQLESDKK